jgi:hypothetical protein
LLKLTNTGPDEASFLLPDGPWATAYRCLLDTTDERWASGTVELPAGSAVLLAPHSFQIFSARR